ALDNDKPLQEIGLGFGELKDVRAVDFQRFIRAEFSFMELGYRAGLQPWRRDRDLYAKADRCVGRIGNVNCSEIDSGRHNLTSRFSANKFRCILGYYPFRELRLEVGKDPLGRKR